MLLPWLAAFLEFGKQFDILGLTEELISFFLYAIEDQLNIKEEDGSCALDEGVIGIRAAERVISRLVACGVTIEE